MRKEDDSVGKVKGRSRSVCLKCGEHFTISAGSAEFEGHGLLQSQFGLCHTLQQQMLTESLLSSYKLLNWRRGGVSCKEMEARA